MKKLQCDLCGGINIIKVNDDTFQCQNCGCQYTSEQLRIQISGVVETTIGSAELNRMVGNADFYYQNKKYREALEEYSNVSKTFPRDHSVWKKYMVCFFEYAINDNEFTDYNIIRYKDTSLAADFKERFPEVINNARMTCGNDSEKAETENLINHYFKTIYDNVLSGQFNFVTLFMSRTVGDADAILNLHPLMRELSNKSKAIISKLDKRGIHFGKAAYFGNVSFWPDKFVDPSRTKGYKINTIEAVIGKYCYWYNCGQPYGNGGDYILSEMPIVADDIPSFYQATEKIAHENYKSINMCPFCGSKKISSLLGHKCKNCKKTF